VADPQYAHALRWAWRIVGWLGVAAIIYLSLEPQPPTFTTYSHEDKIGHVLAYAALMLWFAQIHLTPADRARNALGLLVLGVGLELVQGWEGFRTFSFADMGADAVGVALGWLAAPPRGPDLFRSIGQALAEWR
jgi:VanZ family protein